MLPESVFEKIKTAKDAKGMPLNIETRLLSIKDKRIIHALRSNHPAIPKDVLARLPENIKNWICTYTEREGLVFYSESLKEDKSKRYKIAFAKDSPKDACLTFKTGMIVDAKSLNRKTVIK